MTDKNLIIGMILIIMSNVLGIYQMFIIKDTVFVLYLITMMLFGIGVYIGGK